MKTIMIATVLGLLALAPANAGGGLVPKEAVGTWCAMPSNNDPERDQWGEYYIPWNRNCASDGKVFVDYKGFTAYESGCNFKTVRTAFDRSVASTTKTTGVNVAHIAAECKGEACTWRSTFVLYVSKGVLTMRGRYGEENCD
jgi:hypothetical protein